MDDLCSYVDVFHGSGRIDLPEPEGIAKAWFLKAICGKHIRRLPAVRQAVGGLLLCRIPRATATTKHSPDSLRIRRQNEVSRLSHLHQSGTGAIDIYYNYAVTTPFYGDIYDSALFQHEGRGSKTGILHCQT